MFGVAKKKGFTMPDEIDEAFAEWNAKVRAAAEYVSPEEKAEKEAQRAREAERLARIERDRPTAVLIKKALDTLAKRPGAPMMLVAIESEFSSVTAKIVGPAPQSEILYFWVRGEDVRAEVGLRINIPSTIPLPPHTPLGNTNVVTDKWVGDIVRAWLKMRTVRP